MRTGYRAAPQSPPAARRRFRYAGSYGEWAWLRRAQDSDPAPASPPSARMPPLTSRSTFQPPETSVEVAKKIAKVIPASFLRRLPRLHKTIGFTAQRDRGIAQVCLGMVNYAKGIPAHCHLIQGSGELRTRVIRARSVGLTPAKAAHRLRRVSTQGQDFDLQ